MWLCWDVCLNWFVVNTLFGLRETLHPWVETLVRIVILVDYLVGLESLKSYWVLKLFQIHALILWWLWLSDFELATYWIMQTWNNLHPKCWLIGKLEWIMHYWCLSHVFKVYFGLLFEDKQSFKLGRVDKCQKVAQITYIF